MDDEYRNAPLGQSPRNMKKLSTKFEAHHERGGTQVVNPLLDLSPRGRPSGVGGFDRHSGSSRFSFSRTESERYGSNDIFRDVNQSHLDHNTSYRLSGPSKRRVDSFVAKRE